MSAIPVRIQTANRDRKGEIEIDPSVTVREVLESAQDNWALPTNYEYIVRSDRLGRQLQPNETLGSAGIVANDVLEIQQISDAGLEAME